MGEGGEIPVQTANLFCIGDITSNTALLLIVVMTTECVIFSHDNCVLFLVTIAVWAVTGTSIPELWYLITRPLHLKLQPAHTYNHQFVPLSSALVYHILAIVVPFNL